MNLISNDSGAAFGIFLFIALTAMAVMSFLIISPYMEGLDDAFDQDYRDTYLSTEGQETVTLIKFIFDKILVLFVVIISAIMVINRAIYKGDTR